MENVCAEIINQDGISWHFDRRNLDVSSLIVKEVLGERDTVIQNQHCFMVTDSGGGAMSYINMGSNQRNPGIGAFTIGIFFNFPAGANNGTAYPIISFGDLTGINIFQESGDIFLHTTHPSGTGVVGTGTGGVNYCDGNTHLLFAERYYDAANDQWKISIEVFDSFKNEDNDDGRDLTHSLKFYIGARFDDTPTIVQYGFEGTKFFGCFYIIGNRLSFEDKHNYWKHGLLPVNSILFAQMDENSDVAIYDSDHLSTHGQIENDIAAARATVSDGFSWQNNKGYSTGLYVKGLGTTTIDILGSPHTIQNDELIPFMNYIPDEDVAGYPLEFAGRCRINLVIKKIMCYKGNGTSSAVISVTHDNLDFIPGTDSFCVFWMAEEIETEGGCIIANGKSPNWRYRFDYNPSANEITWNVGGTAGSQAVSAGMRKVIINVGPSTFEIFVDGVSLGTNAVGSSVTASNDLHLFALDDNTQILSDGAVAVVGVRGSIFSSAERIEFFLNGAIPEDTLACWVPSSNGSFIADVAGIYHAEVENYLATIWEGTQDIFPYMFRGFTKMLESLDLGANYVFIPYDLEGKKIFINVYGSTQYDSESVPTEGLVLFPCYLDFNAYDVDLGFFTYFWDKSKSHWNDLDSAYDIGENYYWHSEELNMEYLEDALLTAWLNYTFVDTTFDRFNLPVEAKDLLLLNLGNNQKYVPIPIHY